MPTNALKNQKTSDNLGNFHVNSWEKKGVKASTIYQVSHNFQRANRGPTRLRE